MDSDVINIHTYIKDLYSTKFRELCELLKNPLDYAKVVKCIGNEMVRVIYICVCVEFVSMRGCASVFVV